MKIKWKVDYRGAAAPKNNTIKGVQKNKKTLLFKILLNKFSG